MIETILRKRAGAAGEVGLFPSSEMAAEDLALIGMNNDVTVKVVSEAQEAIRKFMWALAGVVAKSVEGVQDKEDAMDLLCIKARHITNKLDPVSGKLEIKRKSTLRINGEAQLRLLNRMIFITASSLIPGIAHEALRRELEQMVGISYPTQAPRKPTHASKPRRAPRHPKSVERTHGHPTSGNHESKAGHSGGEGLQTPRDGNT